MTRHDDAVRNPAPVRARWLTVRHAANVLSLSPDALRRTLERHAERSPDGGTEANIDGVRGRKFGRLWRVLLTEPWIEAAIG